MRKNILILVILLLGSYLRAQSNGFPQTRSEPTQREIEKREREMEKRKEEYLKNFLSTLDADEFQQVIISQTLTEFYNEKTKIFSNRDLSPMDMKDAISQLEATHFIKIKDIISEGDMKKIENLINGKFDEKEVKKKKKKKKKNKAEN
jgi:hypothetical protein